MFSELALKTTDACRFCWMCRHLCPIGLATGNEGNTPRAKGLLMAGVTRKMEYSAEIASDMYECCLCNACADNCETGFEPAVFIREARTMAVVEDIVPAHVQKLITNAMNTGNIFGKPQNEKMNGIADMMQHLPQKAEILLFVGDTAAYQTPYIAAAIIGLLKKARIDFTVLAEEPSCGYELGDLIGFTDEVKQIATNATAQINAVGAKTMVALDPACARMFKQQYSQWNCSPDCEIVTATSFVAELINKNILTPHASGNQLVTLQDNSSLSRDLDENEPVRKIISAMGFQLKEMYLNRRLTKSCGGILLSEHSPSIARSTVGKRLEDAQRTGAELLITCTPEDFHMLSESSPDGIKTKDIFVLLNEICL